MSARTALIFGVSGQDGAYLARLLLDKGYAVHGASRDAELSSFANLASLGIRGQVAVHSAMPTDFRSIFQVVSKVTPDEIYNLSGQSSVGLSFAQPAATCIAAGDKQKLTLGNLAILTDWGLAPISRSEKAMPPKQRKYWDGAPKPRCPAS